jgi:hypothetical protein
MILQVDFSIYFNTCEQRNLNRSCYKPGSSIKNGGVPGIRYTSVWHCWILISNDGECLLFVRAGLEKIHACSQLVDNDGGFSIYQFTR